jgi:hypothetical protein
MRGSLLSVPTSSERHNYLLQTRCERGIQSAGPLRPSSRESHRRLWVPSPARKSAGKSAGQSACQPRPAGRPVGRRLPKQTSSSNYTIRTVSWLRIRFMAVDKTYCSRSRGRREPSRPRSKTGGSSRCARVSAKRQAHGSSGSS